MGEGPVDAIEHVMELKRRAERAERERDALRADNDRLRESLQRVRPGGCFCHRLHVSLRPCDPCQARAALSADANADAEPERCGFRFPDGRNCRERAGHTDEFHYHPDDSGVVAPYPSVEADAEPSRAEGDEWPEAVSDGLTIPCMRCGEIPVVDYRVDDDFWRYVTAPHERKNVVCIDCLCHDHAGVAAHLLRLQVVDKNAKATAVLSPAVLVRWGPNPHRTSKGSSP